MSEMTELQTSDSACFDPECEGIGEPESEGDLTWFTCDTCNSEFGYVRIPKTPAQEAAGSCQLGVPEAIRKIGSGMGDPSNLPADPNITPITLGRKPS